MSRISEEINNGLFLRKVGGFLCGNSYMVKCPSCRREFTERVWFLRKFRTLKLLARYFNHCSECGGYVCDDCYVIIADRPLDKGICCECAEKHGITGLTTTEFMNGVLLSDKKIQNEEKSK